MKQLDDLFPCDYHPPKDMTRIKVTETFVAEDLPEQNELVVEERTRRSLSPQRNSESKKLKEELKEIHQINELQETFQKAEKGASDLKAKKPAKQPAPKKNEKKPVKKAQQPQKK
mmetsp:Transcript_3332/g.3304  ORF Transcript_3332/g.3304 Transcript_3332/m.3304 type:complete len:115 (-) Transcript_3332:270-614(-)